MTFCGTGPVSEPETKAVSSFIESEKENIVCFLTMHSYGQLILTPYGYTKNKPSNYEELVRPQHQSFQKTPWDPCLPFLGFHFQDFGSSPAFVLHALPYFLSSAFYTLPDACWEGFRLTAALPTLINYLFHKVSSWETS